MQGVSKLMIAACWLQNAFAEPPVCSKPFISSCRSELRQKLSKRETPNAVSFAVYTYTVGERDFHARHDLLPRVPKGIDGFFYTLNTSVRTFQSHGSWAARGWRLRDVELIRGNSYISSERLSSKHIKFVLPGELLRYDWVLSFDDTFHVQLEGLADLVAAHASSALVLLDWRHWMTLDDGSMAQLGEPSPQAYSGFRAFDWEVSSILYARQGYTNLHSTAASEAWRGRMRALVAKPPASAGHPLFGTYYDLSIILQHVSHPEWRRTRDVFRRVYLESRRIPRDQFLLPYFLWLQPAALEHTAAVQLPELTRSLCRCAMEGARRFDAEPESALGFTCKLGLNYMSPCLRGELCPAIIRSRRKCLNMCALRPSCGAAVYNRRKECYLKQEQTVWHTKHEPESQFGTVGCVKQARNASNDRDPAAASNPDKESAYEQQQAAKLNEELPVVRGFDEQLEPQLRARFLRQRGLISSPVLCVGARLGAEVRAFRSVWPGLLSVGIDVSCAGTPRTRRARRRPSPLTRACYVVLLCRALQCAACSSTRASAIRQ